MIPTYMSNGSREVVRIKIRHVIIVCARIQFFQYGKSRLMKANRFLFTFPGNRNHLETYQFTAIRQTKVLNVL